MEHVLSLDLLPENVRLFIAVSASLKVPLVPATGPYPRSQKQAAGLISSSFVLGILG